jgi:hypothetical protein
LPSPDGNVVGTPDVIDIAAAFCRYTAVPDGA